MNGLVEHVYEESKKYLTSTPKEKRKKLGQFITSSETAQYMASLFIIDSKSELHILDPGSGTGMLSAAIIDRLDGEGGIDKVFLTCYENDENVIPVLRSNLEYIKKNVKLELNYTIEQDDYLVSNSSAFNGLERNYEKYDLVIANPPFKKIRKDDPMALCMSSVCYGAPNTYFLFMSMSIHQLKDKGELVYIIPRSWTSGLYFKQFRNYMFKQGCISHIHLFISRDDVFEAESVLQETIIIKFTKKGEKSPIIISSTENNSDFENITELEVPYNIVVQGKDNYVYLVTSPKDIEVLDKISSFSDNLEEIGIELKTGIVVEHRAKDCICDEASEGAIPLICSCHLGNGVVTFPISAPGEYFKGKRNAQSQPNIDYLFVKRFTSKEESRRLQASIYLSDQLSQYTRITTDNKVNYMSGKSKQLSKDEIYGLFVIFNSTLYDQYYRVLNGSTQVNSTEINDMLVPSRSIIGMMGRQLMDSNDTSTETCDSILNGVIDGRIRRNESFSKSVAVA